MKQLPSANTYINIMNESFLCLNAPQKATPKKYNKVIFTAQKIITRVN